MRIELIAEVDGQKVKGLSQMKTLADKGNTNALNLLGEWMMMGFECSADLEFCVICFRKAANKGNTQAMLNLAVCYMEGKGVDADFYAAKRWIWAGLDGGDIEAVGLFQELYLTTIGNHKPDIHEYVDTIYELDPTGEALFKLEGGRLGWLRSKMLSPEEIKKRLYANIVFSARGKSVKEIRKLRGYLTEADIEGFARLQDIRYDEAESTDTRNYDAEVARTIADFQDFISLANREELLLAIRALNKITPSRTAKVLGIWEDVVDEELFDEEIVAANGVNLHDRIYNAIIRACRATKTEPRHARDTLTAPLTWRIKATFDIDECILDQFHVDDVSRLVALVETRLDRIEDGEIQAQYDKCCRDWRSLLKLVTDIVALEFYDTKTVEKWFDAIDNCIAELQDQEVAATFARGKNEYLAMVSLVKMVRGKDIVSSVKEKWLTKLQEATISLQHNELKALCASLDSKSLGELYKIQHKIDSYNFDAQTLSIYKVQLTEAIVTAQNKYLADKFESVQNDYDGLVALYTEASGSKLYSAASVMWRERICKAISLVQQQELQRLQASKDTLGHDELIELRLRMKHYSFDAKVLELVLKPLDKLIDQKEREHLDELCLGIEAHSAAELEALAEKIISLQYRDDNTVVLLEQIKKSIKIKGLLERCVPGRLANCESSQLDELMKEVHFSSLSREEKERILMAIAKQRKINESCESEILKTIDESNATMLKLVKQSFSFSQTGIFVDVVKTYADDPLLCSRISHITREGWKDDEAPLVHIRIANRVDWLLTSRAIRCDSGFCWLYEFEKLKVTVTSNGTCNLSVETVRTAELHGTSVSAWGNPSAWDSTGASIIANAFNQAVREIKEEIASQKRLIRNIRLRYQNEATLSGSADERPFAAFARRYSPETLVEYSQMQFADSKAVVRNSELATTEKKVLLYIFEESERRSKAAELAIESYECAHRQMLAKNIRRLSNVIQSESALFAVNDDSSFATFLSAMKRRHSEYGYVSNFEFDFEEAAQTGLFVCECGGKAALIFFGEDYFWFHSGYDFTHDAYNKRSTISSIEHFSHRKEGITAAPEILVHYGNGNYVWINLPQRTEKHAATCAYFCNEVLKLLRTEKDKWQARELDKEKIKSYFERMRRRLSIQMKITLDEVLATGNEPTDSTVNSFVDACSRQEMMYYEENALSLLYEYFNLPTTTKTPLKQLQKSVDMRRPPVVQSGGTTVQQLAVLDIARLRQMAERLGISYVLDFDNVDIQTFLTSNSGYSKSGQAVEEGEYGIVLFKNVPEPLLLTNIAYYSAQSSFGETHLYHTHPLITAIPFTKYKVATSKTFKANVLKYDYRETRNGVTPRFEGEIPSKLDRDTLERVLQFLNYAAYGIQPTIAGRPTTTRESASPDTDRPMGNNVKNASRNSTAVPALVRSAGTPTMQKDSTWRCGCGSVNSGKFCIKCGKKKEEGTPLWTCSCGTMNKGKFCTKCGSPKKGE